MKLKPTKHWYPNCEESHYKSEYDTFQDFVSDWCGSDGLIDYIDYNFLVRYDIEEAVDFDEEDNKLSTGKYFMKLYFIQQRRGTLLTVIIKSIQESDMNQIEKMLKDAWEYMKELWAEIQE